MTAKKRESLVSYLNRFNIDTFDNLRKRTDASLEQAVAFVKSELNRARSLAGPK